MNDDQNPQTEEPTNPVVLEHSLTPESVNALAEHFGSSLKPARAPSPKTRGGQKSLAILLTAKRPLVESVKETPKTEIQVGFTSPSSIGKRLSWNRAVFFELEGYGQFNSVQAAELYIATHPRDKHDEPDFTAQPHQVAEKARMFSDRTIDGIDRDNRQDKKFTPNVYRDIGQGVWMRVLADADLATDISAVDALYSMYYLKDGVRTYPIDNGWRSEILCRINAALVRRRQLGEQLIEWSKQTQADGTFSQETYEECLQGIWEVVPVFDDIHHEALPPMKPRPVFKRTPAQRSR